MAVVIGHAGGAKALGYSFFSSATAVQAFYIISGFLITMVLNERGSYASHLNFYVSRYLRLWPAYIIIAAISLFTFRHGVMFKDLPRYADWPGQVFIWFTNAALIFQDWVMFLRLGPAGNLVFTPNFSGEGDPRPLWRYLLVPQAWTLGVEITFYILAPFFCRRWQSVLVLFLIGLASRYVVTLYIGQYSDPWFYRFAPSEMMFFASGGLAYFIGREANKRWHEAMTYVGFAFVPTLAIIIVFWPQIAHAARALLSAPILRQELYILNGGALLLFVVAVAPMFYATNRFRWDKWIGELSYPIYINHYLVLRLLKKFAPDSPLYMHFLVYGAVIAVSIAMVYLIINPTEKLRRKWGAGGDATRRSRYGSLEPPHSSAPQRAKLHAIL